MPFATHSVEKQAAFQVELEELAAKYGFELRNEGGLALFPCYSNGGVSTGIAVQFNPILRK